MERKELYRLAIDNEIRSQNLYGALARSFQNADTSTFFKELVQLEKNHEDKLREALAVEFPGYIFLVNADINQDFTGLELSDPTKVLEFAISREEMAHGLYMDFARQTTEPAMKEMLLRLAAEEEQHKTLLLTEIQRIQGALKWYDPSELSGLMED